MLRSTSRTCATSFSKRRAYHLRIGVARPLDFSYRTTRFLSGLQEAEPATSLSLAGLRAVIASPQVQCASRQPFILVVDCVAAAAAALLKRKRARGRRLSADAGPVSASASGVCVLKYTGNAKSLIAEWGTPWRGTTAVTLSLC
jgi:hypothetical protein